MATKGGVMSVCDEGWYCPLWGADWCEWVKRPDSCPYAPILRALPDASEKKLRYITKFLTEIANEDFEEVKAHQWYYSISREVTESE
jgi:hypothetical protein